MFKPAIKIRPHLFLMILCGAHCSIVLANDIRKDTRTSDTNSSSFVDIDKLMSDSSCSMKPEADNNKNQIQSKNRQKLLSSIDERLIKSCLISYEDVQRRIRSKSVEFIDIRSKKQFEDYRVPGSLNLSPFEIKSKAFMQSRHLIILGNSTDLVAMAGLCKELKEHGFKKVNIIKDGLSVWKDTLVGDKAKSIDNWEFGKITSKKFLSLQSKMKWLVLDARQTQSDNMPINEIYSGLNLTSLVIGDKTSLDNISKYIADHNNNNLYGLLVVTEEGLGYKKIHEFLNRNNVQNTFYLEGGIKNYSEYLINRQAFLARLKKGPVMHSSCGGA